MNKLYEYLLKSDYILDNYFSEKSFSFKKTNNDWEKIIYISKYRKEYEVKIIEGTANCIREIKKNCKTYKEVIGLL
jgi:hypothetical protein